MWIYRRIGLAWPEGMFRWRENAREANNAPPHHFADLQRLGRVDASPCRGSEVAVVYVGLDAHQDNHCHYCTWD